MSESCRKFPMRGKYLVRNRCLFLILFITDFFIKFATSLAPRRKIDLKKIESILVCNGAHLGDVLLSSIILPGVRKKFPFAKIGFLTGSWSSEVVNNSPYIDEVYYTDHWKLYRGGKSRLKSFLMYWSSFFSLANKIRKAHYSLALDLYFFYPNSSLLLWLSRVPLRIGYTSGGFGALYTHSLEWVDDKDHVVDYFKQLATIIDVSVGAADLKEFSASIQTPQNSKSLPCRYVVIHPGASLISKEWPISKWIELTEFFQAHNVQVVITGKGSHEMDISQKIIAETDWGINLVNQITIAELVSVIQGSSLTIGIESFAGHLAAGLNVPYVVLKTGMSSQQWAPYGGSGVVLTNPLPCSPCYQSNGCADMLCIKGIFVIDVIDNSESYLKLYPTSVGGKS
jgi:ADP-heptose:LPS heptosyltransferase